MQGNVKPAIFLAKIHAEIVSIESGPSNLNFGHPQTRTTFTGYIPYLPDGEYSIYRDGDKGGL